MTTNVTKVDEKLTKNTDEKTKIAQYAASQIQDDDFIFIDAGTKIICYNIDDCKRDWICLNEFEWFYN